MSQWYCIPPANYLEMMKDWHHHMIIAPHVNNSKTYRQFYLDNPQLYTMLDNGLWEGDVVSNKQLLSMANDLHVNEIIAPDHASGCVTITRTRKFLKYITDKGHRGDFLVHGVVHGNKYHQMRECLRTLVDLGIDIIDLPKMLGYHTRRQLLGSIEQLCTDEYTKIPVHFLGYYKEELPLLQQNRIRSFDTSVPFKPQYGAKFDLDLPYTWKNQILIKHRVRYWKKHYC